MRLDYKILWIENDKKWAGTIKPYLDKHIVSNGYQPDIERYNNREEFYQKNGNNFGNYDFMLVDYSLGDKEYGNEFIELVREHQVYTNILFYSSSAEDLFTKLKEKKISGVYIYDRLQLNLNMIDTTLFKLIDFFLAKELDLNSMRGIAMSEIAKFDKIIWCILAKIKNSDKEIDKDFLSEIQTSHKKQSKKQYDELRSPTKAFKELNSASSSMYFGSTLRSKVLSNELPNEHDYCKKYTDYKVLLEKRNKLAHHMDDSDSSKIFKTEDEKIKFRKDLLNFRRILNETYDAYCSTTTEE